MSEQSFQIQGIDIPFQFVHSLELLPYPDLTKTFFYIRAPYDLTIDKHDIRTLNTGIFIQLPNIVEQRKQDKVINISQNFIQGFVGLYGLLVDGGLVQMSSPITYAGQQIILTLQNHGSKRYDIHRGDEIACLSFLVCPHVKQIPYLKETS